MDIKAASILREQIKTYLIENEVDRTKPNCYKPIADMFGVHPEYIRNVYKKLRKKGLVEINSKTQNIDFVHVDWSTFKPAPGFDIPEGHPSIKTPDTTFTYTTSNDTAIFTQKVYEEVHTLEDLIRVCKIDLDTWEVDTWECKKWDLGIKNAYMEIETKPLFSVRAKLKKKTVKNSKEKQGKVILDELKSISPKVPLLKRDSYSNTYLYELAIFDPHFGKLSWREETGEDYDLKIAEERMRTAISELLSRVRPENIERILLPIGNDLINIDNKNNTTTAGTPQDVDTRFTKIVKNVKRIMIDIIEQLAEVAPVDVIVVPGNHDMTVSFLIGEILESYFFNNQNVTIDNSPMLRKYYQYGKNGFQFTHGNEEKHESLGLIFATEKAQMWADTNYRFSQLGHFHKNKKINYLSVDEFQGFQVQVIPSLSGTDAWHHRKGYMAKKEAKSFLYDKDKGLIAEFTYSL